MKDLSSHLSRFIPLQRCMDHLHIHCLLPADTPVHAELQAAVVAQPQPGRRTACNSHFFLFPFLFFTLYPLTLQCKSQQGFTTSKALMQERRLQERHHRTTEWVGGNLKDHLLPIPCHGQSHSAAQVPIQPSPECLQGWDTHSFLRQLCQCLTAHWVKHFLRISNLNFSSCSLKPFALLYCYQSV